MSIKLTDGKFDRDLSIAVSDDPTWMLACARTARALTSAAALLHKDLGVNEAEIGDIVMVAETLLNVHASVTDVMAESSELRDDVATLLRMQSNDAQGEGAHDCDSNADDHMCDSRTHMARVIANTLDKLAAEEAAGVASDSQPNGSEERCGFIHASPEMSKVFHTIFKAVGEMSANGAVVAAATKDMDPRYGDAVFFCTSHAHGVPAEWPDNTLEAQAKLREYVLRRVNRHMNNSSPVAVIGGVLHDYATAPRTRFERFQFGVKMYPFRNVN